MADDAVYRQLQADGWEISTSSNFTDHCGPFWVKTEDGTTRTGFVVQTYHLNNGGFAHGGMVATLLDRALGLHVRQIHFPKRFITVQLDVHFLDAIPPGSFVEARSHIERTTRTLVFVSGTAFDRGKPVARGNGIWKLRRRPAKSAVEARDRVAD